MTPRALTDVLVLEHPPGQDRVVEVGEEGVEQLELALGEGGAQLVVALQRAEHDGDARHLRRHRPTASLGALLAGGDHPRRDEGVEQLGVLRRGEDEALYDCRDSSMVHTRFRI